MTNQLPKTSSTSAISRKPAQGNGAGSRTGTKPADHYVNDTSTSKPATKKNTASSGFNRAMRLLDEITTHGPLRFAQLQERLQLPKATLNRALSDLQLERMVVFDDHSMTYSAGFRVLELATQIWSKSDLRSLARDQLEALCNRSLETVQLSVLADTHVVHLDSVESTKNVRMSMGFGSKIPVYCTAAGKSLLACSSTEEQKQIISRISFAAYTQNTITDRGQLLAELAQIKSQGYADDNEEHFAGIRSIAAPIVNNEGEAIAAISISAPTFRIEHSQIDQWCQWLVESTTIVSKRIAPVAHRLC